MSTTLRVRAPRLSILLLLAVVLGSACGNDGAVTAGAKGADGAERVTLNLGYFPNITHATAIAGLAEGIYARALGPNVTLETQTFNAGPEATEAIFAGAVDVQFIGPNPAISPTPSRPARPSASSRAAPPAAHSSW